MIKLNKDSKFSDKNIEFHFGIKEKNTWNFEKKEIVKACYKHRLKGCVCYSFASLFFKSKREHFSN